MKIVIVGGGVMGCATALSLAGRGAEVVVLERSVPGAEASTAAAGILGAQVESHGPGDHASALVAARDAYAGWADALRSRVGIDVGYKRCGVMRVALRESDVAALSATVDWQAAAGLRAELLGGEAARSIEPGLSSAVIAAAYFPDDAQVDPRRLLRALVAAMAREPTVTVRSGESVRGLLTSGERCVGVATDSGDMHCDAVVLAAGSWSSLVPGVPASVPAVKPVRGQIVMLDERPPTLRTIVFGAGGYVVPRGDGLVLCGSTMEHVGYKREVTALGVRDVLATAIALAPELASAQVEGMWSSFRPESASGAPLIGASAMDGLFLATGHHRNGILLARHTAQFVTRAVMGD